MIRPIPKVGLSVRLRLDGAKFIITEIDTSTKNITLFCPSTGRPRKLSLYDFNQMAIAA